MPKSGICVLLTQGNLPNLNLKNAISQLLHVLLMTYFKKYLPAEVSYGHCYLNRHRLNTFKTFSALWWCKHSLG